MPRGLNDHLLNDYLEEHLPYEVSMMQHTFLRMAQTGDRADWNSFLESFCLHARNLKGFVTNDRGKGSNSVVARAFVPTFSRKLPPQLTGAFQRLNEQMAHLAKRRVVDPAKKFTFLDAREVLGWLEQAMQEFVGSLSAQDAALWNRAGRKPKQLVIDASNFRDSATNVIQMLTHTSPVVGGPLVVIARN